MPAEDLLSRLDRFAVSMRDFLTVLEGSTPEDDRVNRSWEGCQEAFDALAGIDSLLEGLPSGEREEAEDRIDELVRLNAVVTAAIRRERDELVSVLDQAHGTRKAFSYYGREESTGGTCDMSG